MKGRFVIDPAVSPLLQIPRDVLIEILLRLPPQRRELLNVTSTCKAMLPFKSNPALFAHFPLSFDYSEIKSKTSLSIRNLKETRLSPNSRELAMVIESVEGEIKFHDARNGNFIAKVAGKNGAYSFICYSPNSEYLLAMNAAVIDIWDLKSRKLFRSCPNTQEALRACWISDIEFIVSNRVGSLYLQNIHREDPELVIEGKIADAFFFDIIVSPDRNLLALQTLYSNGLQTIQILNLSTKAFVDWTIKSKWDIGRYYNNHNRVAMVGVIFSKDSKYIYYTDHTMDNHVYRRAIDDLQNTDEKSVLSQHYSMFDLIVNELNKIYAFISQSYDDRSMWENVVVVKGFDNDKYRKIDNYCRNLFMSPEGDRVITVSWKDKNSISRYGSDKKNISTVSIFKFPALELQQKATDKVAADIKKLKIGN